MSALDEIVKAYDIRGVVPDQLDAEVAHALGVAFAEYAGAPQVLVARDMRPSGVELVAAFTAGARRQGVDVVDLGLASSDLLYFASGALDRPGAMFTASHNPAGYNGVKLCLAGARPLGIGAGFDEIKQLAAATLDGVGPVAAPVPGRRTTQDLLERFVDHVVSFIDPDQLQPVRVVADTANGMGGLVVPAVFERLASVELEVLYGELDGTFPNHPADPLQPANQHDVRARVVAGAFDLGLAFDGDADRVFVVDETGSG
ncbi:MAG: phosphomannomutase/phosphoglucomutase, partial [Ilumatobacteraceae bacterium]